MKWPASPTEAGRGSLPPAVAPERAKPPSRLSPQSPSLRRPVALAAALAALVQGACVPSQTPDVPPPPDPFVRYPHVQAVTDSSARILWTVAQPLPDTLLYWPEPAGDTVRLAAPREPTRTRSLRLAPLPADTRVGYRIRLGPERSATPVHRFRTAPEPGSRLPGPILVFGDSGAGTEAQIAVARRMAEVEGAELLLHTGDVAYPDGTETDLTVRHFRVYRELLARVPFFPSPGNHDVRTQRGAPFRRAFLPPGGTWGPGGLHYAFDWGSARLIALDTTGREEASGADLRERGAQYRWLEEELAAAATSAETAWIVVYFHHPPYTSNRTVFAEPHDGRIRELLAPLFDRYGVDLVLTGHDHHYERSHPLRGGRIDEDTPGTVYIVTGGGGARFELFGVGRRDHAAATAGAHHFVALRFGEGAIELEAIARDGSILDRARIAPVPPEPAAVPEGPGPR